jgi:hypothetical protein
LFFGVDITAQLRFTRVDSGAAVTVSTRLDRVPADARVAQLLPKLLNGVASTEETAVFQRLWQGRVRTLLLDYADDPETIVVQHRGIP